MSIDSFQREYFVSHLTHRLLLLLLLLLLLTFISLLRPTATTTTTNYYCYYHLHHAAGAVASRAATSPLLLLLLLLLPRLLLLLRRLLLQRPYQVEFIDQEQRQDFVSHLGHFLHTSIFVCRKPYTPESKHQDVREQDYAASFVRV